MRLIHCACGAETTIPGAEEHLLSDAPSRSDLTFLTDAARELLPVDPTPSLDEIQRSPDVAHLGEPAFAPQEPAERLRVVVSGTDRSLGLVLTRLMRADAMWVEVGYVPVDTQSPAAVLWGAGSVELAVEGAVRPAPCIRSDFGEVVAGSAELMRGGGERPFVGEVVVDSAVLVPGDGDFGARLVPTVDAPGLAATAVTTPFVLTRRLLRRVPVARTDASRVLSGRALQSGGEDIAVRIDAHLRPRTVNRVTFYRHLRDIQSVRDA